MLAPAQFDKVLASKLASDGGFSVRVDDQTSPTEGVMASRYGAEEKIQGLASAADIGSYRAAHGVELAERGAYFGGWDDEGVSYLDVAQRFNRVDDAHEFARRNAQIATYDIESDTTRLVHYGPAVRPLDVVNPLLEHRAATARKNAAGRGLVRQHLKARAAGTHDEQMAEARRLGEAIYQSEGLTKERQGRRAR